MLRTITATMATMLLLVGCGDSDQQDDPLGSEDGVVSLQTWGEGIRAGPVDRDGMPPDSKGEPVTRVTLDDGSIEFWARPMDEGFFVYFSDNVLAVQLKSNSRWINPDGKSVPFSIRYLEGEEGLGFDVKPDDYDQACSASAGSLSCGRFEIDADMTARTGDTLDGNADGTPGDDAVIVLGGLG